MKSDKSRFKSKDYTDNETDNKDSNNKDYSNNKDQEDNNYKVINN